MPGYDSGLINLGFENSKDKDVKNKDIKRAADNKSLITIGVFLLLAVLLFFLGSIGINKENRQISELKRTDKQRNVKLFAVFDFEGSHIQIEPEIKVKAIGSEEEELSATLPDSKDWLTDFAEKTVKEINKNADGESLVLPSEKDGVKIRWILPKGEKPFWIFGLFVLLSAFVWFSRYDGIKKKEKERAEDFETEIPNMIFRYVLLLNAGLVTEVAFKRLTEETAESTNPLYEKLGDLYMHSESENLPFSSLLYSFSIKYPSRDFMRFASLVYENAGRGSRLAEKLEQEASSSYDSRLLTSKGKIKQAETKLCFPLILLLISLVIICIAPAMMGM